MATLAETARGNNTNTDPPEKVAPLRGGASGAEMPTA